MSGLRRFTGFVSYAARRLLNAHGTANYAYESEALPLQRFEGTGFRLHQQWSLGLSPIIQQQFGAVVGLGGLQAGQFVGQSLADPNTTNDVVAMNDAASAF